MHGLQQMQCNSNHYSIKRNTLVELKILSVSNDYKPMKLWSSFSEIWEKDSSNYLELDCKQHGKY